MNRSLSPTEKRNIPGKIPARTCRHSFQTPTAKRGRKRARTELVQTRQTKARPPRSEATAGPRTRQTPNKFAETFPHCSAILQEQTNPPAPGRPRRRRPQEPGPRPTSTRSTFRSSSQGSPYRSPWSSGYRHPPPVLRGPPGRHQGAQVEAPASFPPRSLVAPGRRAPGPAPGRRRAPGPGRRRRPARARPTRPGPERGAPQGPYPVPVH